MKLKGNLSRLPDNSVLKQQHLPASQFHLSANEILAGFFAIGLLCFGIGIILILSSKSMQTIEINYPKICGNCTKLRQYAYNFEKECTCSIPFYLPEKMRNIQNCAPFGISHNGTPIAPCGAIANSMFNDTIILSYHLNSSIHIKVPMLRSGLTWWTNKYVKFQNPSSRNLFNAFAGIVAFWDTIMNYKYITTKGTTKPPYWPKPVYHLDVEEPSNNGFINKDFTVWMQTAAFPAFKKLYCHLNRIQHFTEGLPVVTSFQGEKAVVLSTLTWSGGSGLFLGFAYTVTGAMMRLAFFSMMAIHLKLKKRETFFLQQ